MQQPEKLWYTKDSENRKDTFYAMDKLENTYVDLHLHSLFSDGSFTPSELVSLAKKAGLSALCLTDHDTVSGTGEMIAACKAAGLDTLPGIELSCTWQDKSIHILGYGMNWQKKGFGEKLKEWQKDRENRYVAMTARLQKGGYDISMETLRREFPGAVLTRAHLAVYLADTGQISDKDTAFKKLIGKGCPFYVPRKPVRPEEAIEFLLSYGGVPVFAHPILTRMCEPQLDSFTGYLAGLGLKGMEGYYSGYTEGEEVCIARIAEKYGLFLTGGSDFHGKAKPSISVGTGKGRLAVPRSCYEALLLQV